jgi:hypothetical protein
MHFTDFVGFTGVVKDSFGSGGFTSINMGHDAKIAIPFE